jgi:hypothetical protein
MAPGIKTSQTIVLVTAALCLTCACGIGYHAPPQPPPPPFYSVLYESPQYNIDLHANVGHTSKVVSVRYKNLSSQPLKLRAPFFGKNEDHKFHLETTCTDTLAQSATCTVNIDCHALEREMIISDLTLCLQDSTDCRSVVVFGWGHDKP